MADAVVQGAAAASACATGRHSRPCCAPPGGGAAGRAGARGTPAPALWLGGAAGSPPGQRLFWPPIPSVDDLDGFPAPSVVVLAPNALAVSRHARHAVVALAAELSGLVADAAVRLRVAARRRQLGCRLVRR